MQTKKTSHRFKYDVFISYSRKDRVFAEKLEKAIDNYKPPKIIDLPQRRLNAFRDESDLVGADYYQSVDNFIGEAAKLIVICSPNSANSKYVNDEIKRFSEKNDPHNIIPVIIDGLPKNEGIAKGQEDLNAFPPALSEALKEPLAKEYRGFNPRKDKINRGAFEGSWLNIISEILDISRDELEQREKKRQQQQRRIIMVLTISILAILATSTIIAVFKNVEAEKLFFDNTNYHQAKIFEEKAGRELENQNREGLQKSWLYTLGALAQNITSLDPRRQLPISEQRLKFQGVSVGVYQQLWRSPGSINKITRVAYSPDGRLLAIATEEGVIRLCDMQSGEELISLTGHKDVVTSVAFNSTGKYLASGSKDNTIRIWKLVDDPYTRIKGREVAIRKGHTREVRSVAFHPHNNLLASSSKDGTICLWKVHTPGPLDSLFNRLPFIEMLDVTVDTLAVLKGHKGDVWAIAFSPDGEMLASASMDTTVRLWDVAKAKEIAVLHGHKGPVWAVAFSPDGRYLASGSKDQRILLWDVAKKQQSAMLSGHEGDVWTLAFNPEGAFLASGSDDHSVRIWDIKSGKEVQKIQTHHDIVWSVVFSPDGKWLVSGSQDNTIGIWDVANRRELAQPVGHTGEVNSIAFSPDGRYLASGSNDFSILLWQADRGEDVMRLTGHRGVVSCVEFSPDGRYLASGAKDDTVRLWDVASGKTVARFGEAGNDIRSLAFSPDGKRIAITSKDQYLYLWNLETGKSARLIANQGDVKTVDFSPAGRRIATGGADGTICLWDAQSLRKICQWRAHRNITWGVRFGLFSRDSTLYLASVSKDESLRLWDVRVVEDLLGANREGHQKFFSTTEALLAFELEGQNIELGDDDKTYEVKRRKIDDRWSAVITSRDKLLLIRQINNRIELRYSDKNTFREFLGHTDDIWSVDFDSKNDLLVSGSGDETVRIWDVRTGSELAVLNGHTDDVASVAFSPDTLRLASGSWDHSVRIWDLNESRQRDNLTSIGEKNRGIAFSPDGSYLVSVGDDRQLHRWNANSLREESIPFTSWGGTVLLSVAVSQNGKYIAYGGEDDNIYLWDLDTNRRYALEGHQGDGICVAFSPDNRYIAAGSSDGEVRIWEVESRKQVALRADGITSNIKHSDKVRSVAFSHDSRLLASGSSDNTIKIYHMIKHQVVKVFDKHRDGVWSVAFSPDDKFLASGSWDTTIRKWDVKTGNSITLEGHSGPVLTLVFSRDGEKLISGSRDRTIRIWDIQAKNLIDILRVHRDDVASVAISPNGQLLASASWDHTIRVRNIRDLETGKFDTKQFNYYDYRKIFAGFSYLLGYHLDEENNLIEEPSKFYLKPLDEAVFPGKRLYQRLEYPREPGQPLAEWIKSNLLKAEFLETNVEAESVAQ